jgi:hypothetical protein
MIAMTTSNSTNVKPLGCNRILIDLAALCTRITPLTPMNHLLSLRKSPPQLLKAEESIKQSFECFSIERRHRQANRKRALKREAYEVKNSGGGLNPRNIEAILRFVDYVSFGGYRSLQWDGYCEGGRTWPNRNRMTKKKRPGVRVT